MALSQDLHSGKGTVHFKTSEKMAEVDDESIQAVITSPPYWNLKNYKHRHQIGFGESYDKYHERLDSVWRECLRTIKPEGSIWIVVDKIMSSDEVIPLPYDIASHCERIGFHLQDAIVWNKPTAIAGMSSNNLVNKYEMVIMLSKSQEFRLNDLPRPSTPDFGVGMVASDLWRLPVKAGSIRKTPMHDAPYPEELIYRIVRLASKKMDAILDPFLGSGTTLKVALDLERNCIGYEINPDFQSIMGLNVSQISYGFEPTPRSGDHLSGTTCFSLTKHFRPNGQQFRSRV